MLKVGKKIIPIILGLFILGATFVVAQENDQDNNANTNTSDEQTINSVNSDGEEADQVIVDLKNKIEENETKIENLKKAAAEYSQKIDEYKDLSATLKNQLGLVDNQIIKLQLDVKTAQLQIDKAKLEIESMEYQIDNEQTEIEKQKEALIEYIRQIAKNDERSYLEILILNESFAEFFNQLNYLKEVQSDIQKTVERLKLLKAAIESQMAEKERQKQDLENYQNDLLGKENRLQDDQKAKEIVLLESKTSEIQFQKLLLEAKQSQNEIDSEILGLQDQINDKIQKLRKEGSTSKTTLLDWPVPSHEITAYFHDPEYPFRYVYEHPAIDIRAKQGTAIASPADGYVARAKDAGYGYSYIILIHDNGLSTVYGHASAIYVKEDSYVKAGDIIGLTGGMPGTRGAGRLTIGPHLHFEVRLNGLPVNPLEYLP